MEDKDFEKQFIGDLICRGAFGDDWSVGEIKNLIIKDCDDLIDLRNRIDGDDMIFGEDVHTIDHILEYMELLMKYLKMEEV